MQYMPSLKNSPTQAIRWLSILAGFYPSLEKLIDRFCHGFANFNRLKGRQLWLNPYHCQPAQKTIYYEPIKVTINVLGLAKVIINIVIRHYGLPNSIVTDRGLLFTSKFWSLLYYFSDIKQKLSTAFYL